jgi:hypothetical protein
MRNGHTRRRGRRVRLQKRELCRLRAAREPVVCSRPALSAPGNRSFIDAFAHVGQRVDGRLARASGTPIAMMGKDVHLDICVTARIPDDQTPPALAPVLEG